VNMDRLLEREGFLQFSAGQAVFARLQSGRLRALARKVYDRLGLHGRVSLPQSVNWARTRAYTSIRSTGEGVSVNLIGREPQGVVSGEEFDRVLEEVERALRSFTDPATGQKPIARVARREEAFTGRHLEHAPDLLLEPTPGYSLTHAKGVLEDADWMSGDHRVAGVIAARGPRVRTEAFAESPSLVDLAPTVLAALDVPASAKHDGQVLSSVVGEEAAVRSGAEPVAAATGVEAGPDEAEAAEMEEHLRGLGYLE